MANIGIIGHPMISGIIEEVMHKYFKDVVTTKIDLVHINQVQSLVQYLQSQQDYFDGFIFTGKIPYDIMNHTMHSKNPWVYVEQNQSQLQRTLLQATLTTDYDPLNISLDSYDKKTITNTYQDIGIGEGEYIAFVSELDIFDDDFLTDLVDFHVYNYKQHKVSLCVTGISSVYEALQDEGIPSMLLTPTSEVIKQTVNHLLLKMRSQINDNSRIVVLSIEIDLLNEYSLINENEYQLMTEKTKVTEKVYWFAQSIQATVIEIGKRGYLLFSTKNILEYETNNLQKITLLNKIERQTESTISMGIGYGVTAREANYSATLGMHRAKKRGGNQCFVVDSGAYYGPIFPDTELEETPINIDKTFNRISEKTGVGIDTIFKLHCIIDQQSKNTFTPKELADALDITLRSINRLLEKFEDAGYMKVVGKRVVGGAGRPSRIVELKL